VRAVDGVSFELASGELLGMMAEWRGKSTANLLNGQLRADAGSVQLGGAGTGGPGHRQIWQRSVGHLQIARRFVP
jgi:branched-chain amino acid transport system ATP-binding protein